MKKSILIGRIKKTDIAETYVLADARLDKKPVIELNYFLGMNFKAAELMQ